MADWIETVIEHPAVDRMAAVFLVGLFALPIGFAVWFIASLL